MLDGEFNYLQRLTLRLTIGAAQLPDACRERHAQYILSRQRQDGGWSGREGDSDLYYTSFALRSLAILGLLEGTVAERASDFLQSRLDKHETLVDLMSLVYSAKLLEAACGLDAFRGSQAAWAGRLATLLDSLRRPDGGYSKSFEGNVGSTLSNVSCSALLGADRATDTRRRAHRRVLAETATRRWRFLRDTCG